MQSNNMKPRGVRSACAAAMAALFMTCQPTEAQSNIVFNGSFEEPGVYTGWEFGGMLGSQPGTYLAFHGTNWLEPYGTISQELATVAGRGYVVRFACGNGSQVRVHWGESESVDLSVHNPSVSDRWLVTNVVFTATSTQTRLQFESIAEKFRLDAVEVGWLEEPPTITIPVPSRSTFEGGNASFPVGAIGGPPLRYQWYRDDIPLPNATNQVLMLPNLAKADEGTYWVNVTNGYGAASSLRASLIVNPLPKVPLIVAQPKSQSTLAGYAAAFHVVAFGDEPLGYQWKLNNANIPDATNSCLILPAVGLTNAGDYSVAVNNQFGTALSITGNLQVVTGAPGGGWVMLANRIPWVLDAPVFDVDGTTRLVGSNYVAQLYAGATPDTLHSLGGVSYFRKGTSSGYFYSSGLEVPDVAPGQTAYLQVRVWDYTCGKTFEEAQARGGRFGKSNLIPAVMGDFFQPPEAVGLRSFALQAGMSLLATAKFEQAGVLADGQRQWLLIGDSGYRYVVEHRTPPNDWLPLLTLTNETGVVLFTDPVAQGAAVRFYRARIIEP